MLDHQHHHDIKAESTSPGTLIPVTFGMEQMLVTSCSTLTYQLAYQQTSLALDLIIDCSAVVRNLAPIPIHVTLDVAYSCQVTAQSVRGDGSFSNLVISVYGSNGKHNKLARQVIIIINSMCYYNTIVTVVVN